MEEVVSKAIPLRRSRSGSRSTPAPPARWTDGVTANVRRAFGPPRQVWLAGLGASALAVRGARVVWAHLVAEGVEAEATILGTLARRPG